VAIQQGRHAAPNIRALVDDRPVEPFAYRDRGMMATIGRKAAVGVVGNWHLKGFVAWLAWLFVHLLFLIGFRNKLSVMINWAYSYIAFGRGSRLIVGDVEDDKALPEGSDADSETQAA
jgi:NADH dehydrogenase